MKKIILPVFGIIVLFAVQAAAFDLPEFDDTTPTKIRMPGGIHYDMPKDKAIALMKKRHPVDIYENGAGYQVTENGFQEGYGIRFKCGRVWAISYSISGPDSDAFYQGLEPYKKLIDNLRSFYHGPVYGEYTIKVRLLDNEEILLNSWNTVIDGQASFTIELSFGDSNIEPSYACSEKK